MTDVERARSVRLRDATYRLRQTARVLVGSEDFDLLLAEYEAAVRAEERERCEFIVGITAMEPHVQARLIAAIRREP